jgi:hypothetical protein
MTLAKKFFGTTLDLAVVEDEATVYFLSPQAELPQYQEDTPTEIFWKDMSEMEDAFGKHLFKNFCEVSFLVHSNADSERCFSIVRKIWTGDRLSHDTFNSLLCAKFNREGDCCE